MSVPMPTSKSRPSIFRALGKNSPPFQIEIADRIYAKTADFKHDSWAATALYASGEHRVVCKFNRTQSAFGFPCKWIGRLLARRETDFLWRLGDIPGIPRYYDLIKSCGEKLPNATAHNYVDGKPLSLVFDVDEAYFRELETLLEKIHQRNIAYVDLHKPENVLVGTDGKPYLIDFQISVRLPGFRPFSTLLKMLQASDRYHLTKHKQYRLNYHYSYAFMNSNRPWWIRWHRKLAVPIRTLRRRILVALGIRAPSGMANTEKAVEPGLTRSENNDNRLRPMQH